MTGNNVDRRRGPCWTSSRSGTKPRSTAANGHECASRGIVERVEEEQAEAEHCRIQISPVKQWTSNLGTDIDVSHRSPQAGF